MMLPCFANGCSHRKLHLIITLLIASSLGLKAQKSISSPSISELKTEFGNSPDIACISSSIAYTFDYSPKTKITTTQTINEEFVALKSDVNHTIYLDYNEFTDIDNIKAYDKKDKVTDATVMDYANEQQGGDYLYTGQRMKTFTLNFDQAGDKGGYKGQRFFSDPKYVYPAYFRDIYPVMEKTITITIPKWLNAELKEMNFEGYDIQKTVTTNPKNGATIYTYVGTNLKAVDYTEKNVPGTSYMYPHILMLFKSYTEPSGNIVTLLSSVGDVYAWYHKLGGEADNNDATLKPLVADIVKGKTTDVDKVKAIYYWVEDNIRYLAVENGIAGDKPDACQNVLQKRFGDCKGMANLLVHMLRIGGFDARQVWLGTKEISYDYSLPSRFVANHSICALVLNGKYYFLDGTEKYAPFNDNADRIQGKQALIENGDKYVVQTIPVAPIGRSKVIINKTFTVAPNDILAGNEHTVYNGESKTDILYTYHEVPSDKKQQALTMLVVGNDPNLAASNITSSDLENREIPVKIAYQFKLKNQVSDFDNDIYISIDNDKYFEGLTFDSNRLCDFEFDYRKNVVVNDTLIVPAGYTVKHLPDNLDKETPNYVFKVTTTQSGNNIIYHKELQILNEIIRIKNFATWNADLAELRKIYDDQIIISKS